MRLLLVCGDGGAASYFQKNLQKHGYSVDVATSEADAQQAVKATEFDAIVVREEDESAMDMITVTRRLRGEDVGEPLLIVPEEADEDTVTDAFDAGADQVMDPDHGFKELLARIRGLLRQCDPTPGDKLTYRDVELDLPRLSATRAGKSLGLIGKPYALLEFFLRRPEVVHTREAIGRSVWDENFDPFSNVIDVTVSKVRQQLDKPFDRPYLHTVVGSGYMLSHDPPGRSDWG
ncbi:MAG: response regulator transcription factor [Planctomycetota bacterium]